MFKVRKTRAGYDWRNLPMISYLGSTRPDYDRLDNQTCEILRSEIIGNLRLWKSMDKDLDVPDDKTLRKMEMHVLHATHDQRQRIMTAKNSAINYKSMIIGGSWVLERGAQLMGMKQDTSFVQQQIRAMPIYNTTVTEMSMAYGAGPLEGMPPFVKFAALIFGSYAINFVLNKISKKAGKNNHMDFWMEKFYQMGGAIPDNNSAETRPKKNKKKPKRKDKVKNKAKKMTREENIMNKMAGTPKVEEVNSDDSSSKKSAKKKKDDESSAENSKSDDESSEEKNSKKSAKKKKVDSSSAENSESDESEKELDNESDSSDESEAEESPIPKAKKAEAFNMNSMLKNVMGSAAPLLAGLFGGGGGEKKKKSKKKNIIYDQ